MALFCLNAHATGKLSIEPSYDPENDESHVTFGLAIYEKLDKDIYYSSWTGFGDSFDLDSNYKDWYVTKHQLDFKLTDGVTFAPGGRVNLKAKDGQEKQVVFGEVFTKISLTLW